MGYRQDEWTGWRLYLCNLAIAIDQLGNAILFGDPTETISSRMGKRLKKTNCKVCSSVCLALHLLDRDHCHKASVKNIERRRRYMEQEHH